ncbi:hypothetical protein C8F04DRAFT_1196416 [Mycena alexandri]|uniref:Uncharacterized protein n=1 Tax=Mycena alexandri TaxID=1745969 RepID=A0AAD6S7P7_9AGAR|nr:hypothetical protein C8F04DRAFT_1196416 [Mycena alexandri]
MRRTILENFLGNEARFVEKQESREDIVPDSERRPVLRKRHSGKKRRIWRATLETVTRTSGYWCYVPGTALTSSEQFTPREKLEPNEPSFGVVSQFQAATSASRPANSFLNLHQLPEKKPWLQYAEWAKEYAIKYLEGPIMGTSTALTVKGVRTNHKGRFSFIRSTWMSLGLIPCICPPGP